MHALRRLILGTAIGFLVSLPLLLILALAGDEQVSLATVGGFFWVIVAALLIGSSYALLEDETKVPISRRRLSNFLEWLKGNSL